MRGVFFNSRPVRRVLQPSRNGERSNAAPAIRLHFITARQVRLHCITPRQASRGSTVSPSRNGERSNAAPATKRGSTVLPTSPGRQRSVPARPTSGFIALRRDKPVGVLPHRHLPARRIVRAGRVLQGASEGVYDCTRPSEQRRKARDAPRDKRGGGYTLRAAGSQMYLWSWS